MLEQFEENLVLSEKTWRNIHKQMFYCTVTFYVIVYFMNVITETAIAFFISFQYLLFATKYRILIGIYFTFAN